MSRVDEVGARDGWRCWLCDEAVDPEMSVNDPRGPSVDSLTTRAKGKAKAKAKGKPVRNGGGGGDVDLSERLAHRACNTKKGAIAAVVPWPDELFVVDPAPIIPVVDRLGRRGGREAVGRCPTQDDADAVAAWLTDRCSRLEPMLELRTTIEPGGGQFLVVLHA